jgi:hypothetical protein
MKEEIYKEICILQGFFFSSIEAHPLIFSEDYKKQLADASASLDRLLEKVSQII